MVKIQQSFAFGVLWHTSGVSCLCIQRALACSYEGKLKLTKASSMLMHVAYTGKPMSPADMDSDKHIVMIMHTIQYEYAPTAVALSAYPHHKVKSTHDHERATLLTMGVHHKKCKTTHKQTNIYIYIYIHTHISCTMQAHKVGNIRLISFRTGRNGCKISFQSHSRYELPLCSTSD